MKRVTYFFRCFLLMLPSISFCQSQFYDRQHEPSTAGKSYYYLAGKKNKQGNFYDSLKTYYTKTGRLRSFSIHDRNGLPIGDYETFWENGKLKSSGRFEKKNFKLYQNSTDSVEQIILEFYDSTGHPQVQHGNGFIAAKRDQWYETGRITNGVRDSVWTALYDNGKIFWQESWFEGELVDGVSYDEQGTEHYYTHAVVVTQPEEGFSAFYERIGEMIDYPKEAEKRSIEGKIIVEFTVEADGTITSPHVVKGLGFGCDEEAIRVLMKSPVWKPCLKRGQPVRSRAIVPFLFKLT